MPMMLAADLSAQSAPTQKDAWQPYLEQTDLGYIDWDNGMIYGYGEGRPDLQGGSKAAAYQAARMVAYQSVLRLASGLRLNQASTLESLGNGRLVVHLEGMVRASETERVWVGSDAGPPHYRVVLKAPIKGVDGLTARVLGLLKKLPAYWTAFPSEGIDPDPVDDTGPWLVLDTRGLPAGQSVQPALFPTVTSASGATVYDVSSTDETHVKTRGMARYVVADTATDTNVSHTPGPLDSKWQAALFAWLSPADAQAQTKKKRRGQLIVRQVQGAEGLMRTNLVVSEADAVMLKAEDQASQMLKNCRVVIVMDAPIGGIEGFQVPVYRLTASGTWVPCL